MKKTSLGNLLKADNSANATAPKNDLLAEDPAGYLVVRNRKCAEASTWSKVVGDVPADEAGYIVSRCSTAAATSWPSKGNSKMRSGGWATGDDAPKSNHRTRGGQTKKGRAEASRLGMAWTQNKFKQNLRGPETRSMSCGQEEEVHRIPRSTSSAMQAPKCHSDPLTTDHVTSEEQSMNQWLMDTCGWDFSTSTPQEPAK